MRVKWFIPGVEPRSAVSILVSVCILRVTVVFSLAMTALLSVMYLISVGQLHDDTTKKLLHLNSKYGSVFCTTHTDVAASYTYFTH